MPFDRLHKYTLWAVNVELPICIADHYEYIKSDHFAIRFNLDIKGTVKRLKHPKRSVRNLKKNRFVSN